jgi:hypothetical protein
MHFLPDRGLALYLRETCDGHGSMARPVQPVRLTLVARWCPDMDDQMRDRATFVTLLSLSTRAGGRARRGASLGDGHQSVVYLGRSIHYTRPIVARHFGRGVPYLVPMGMEEECK